MGLKVLEIVGYNPTSSLKVALEKEETYQDIYNSKSTFGKLLMKLISRIRYDPQVTFQKEDVDEEVIYKLLKHIDLLDVVEKWMYSADSNLLSQLLQAKKEFEKIQTPPNRKKLYRGFSLKNSGQQHLGLNSKEDLKNLKIGDTWSFTPDKPISFTFHQATAEDFGDVIVGIDFYKEKNRMFHITNEIVVAFLAREAKDFYISDKIKIPTYGESIFLPDLKPLQVTLISKK